MLTEKHNDEKLTTTLLIVGGGLIAYHFQQKINGIIIHNPFLSHWHWNNATAFGGASLGFSVVIDDGVKERKRHDLAQENFQRARDKWNENRMKRLDFITKRLREKNEARAYINNADEAMLEYYRVFAKKNKILAT